MEIVKSYAKVNLGLSVIKKTKKNYHKLKMIMSQIELYDEIVFEESDDIIVTTSTNVCEMKDNLCYKVALYLKEQYAVQSGIKIHIIKKIPDGGGLGGGSSNAACVLKYLNNYWCLGLTDKKMKQIGFIFGCDIPFFIGGDISYVYSYGEKVKKIKAIERNDNILLIIPKFKNSTKKIFNNHIIKKETDRNIKQVVKALKKGDYKETLYNDLEVTADLLSKGEINNIKSKLYELGLAYVIMSGSGSTIIVYCDKNQNIDIVKEKVKKMLPEVDVVSSKLKMYAL